METLKISFMHVFNGIANTTEKRNVFLALFVPTLAIMATFGDMLIR